MTMKTALNRPYDRDSYILVVDDDHSILKFFKIHLNKFFSHVIVVENVAQAVKEMENNSIAIVISDIRMPRTDGLQFMRKVRRMDQTIPVLLVSGELVNEEQQDQISEADGFLKKPFSIDDFHQFVIKGIELREAFNELHGLIKEKKNFRKLIKGQLSFDRQFAKKDLGRAKELSQFLKVS